MNPTLTAILDILKYTIPALVVLIATSVIVKRFLVSELQRKQLALLQETVSVTMPLRLQAYERLTIFAERVHPRYLIPRLYETGMPVAALRHALITAINAEFEHNLSQQIYVSRQVWQTVVQMKEQELALIHQIAEQLPPESPATELHRRIIDYLMSSENDLPTRIAIDIIAEEAKTVLAYRG
jgi:hypothetical protein